MSPNRHRTFAFDWDGTLVGCRARQVAVLAAVWPESDFVAPPDFESFWNLKREGMTTLQAVRKIGVVEEVALTIADRWRREIEQSHWLKLDTVMTQGFAALKKAAGAGFTIIIITARMDSGAVRKQISDSPLSAMINEVYVVDPLGVDKQKAAVLADRKVAAFVGDSESDFEAARRAGVLFAGVACGQRSLNYLEQHGVEPLFADPLLATTYLLVRAANKKNALSGNTPLLPI